MPQVLSKIVENEVRLMVVVPEWTAELRGVGVPLIDLEDIIWFSCAFMQSSGKGHSRSLVRLPWR